MERLNHGGPGGQHANKTASAVRLRHPSGVEAWCADHREAGRNQTAALRRLRVRLAATLRGVADPAWLAPYRQGGRLRLGANANDYPLVAAVLLDALAAAAGSLTTAAAAVALSTSQLAKLLTADPDIRRAADGIRTAHDLGPVHD